MISLKTLIFVSMLFFVAYSTKVQKNSISNQLSVSSEATTQALSNSLVNSELIQRNPAAVVKNAFLEKSSILLGQKSELEVGMALRAQRLKLASTFGKR